MTAVESAKKLIHLDDKTNLDQFECKSELFRVQINGYKMWLS